MIVCARRLATVAAIAVTLFVPRVDAQQLPAPEPAHKDEPETEPRNEAAVIAAGTWELEGDTFFTLGGEYERRFTNRVGLIGEVEYLFDADRWVVAAPIAFHPGGGVKIFGGPGFERAEVEDEGTETEVDETETHFLFRIGASHAVEFAGRFSFGPTLSLDFVHETENWSHAVVLGISFGVAF